MSEHKLDEETRKKMMSRLPFSRNVTIEHTPKSYMTKELDSDGNETSEYEIPEEYRPVFEVRPFSKMDKDKIKKISDKPDDSMLRTITRQNIMSVKQLYDAGTMEEITFKADPNGGMDADQFESLPVIVIRDLFIFISGISGLSSYERSGL